MSHELRRCPFCGGPATLNSTQDKAQCADPACVCGYWHDIRVWNRRPIEAALEAQVAALKQQIENGE